MSNSPLVNYTRISPNKSINRKYSITRITPHCVVGQASVESLGDIFSIEHKQASSNYGIGRDGRVGMYVEEKDRSWCSSSSDNDNRAVTIECASDTKYPYTFKTVVYEKLIELCVDICKRNGKNKLIWINNKSEALSYVPAPNEMQLTVHRWFANKECPGDWLYSRLGDVATLVTNQLNAVVEEPEKEEPEKEEVKKPVQQETNTGLTYRVQIGIFSQQANVDRNKAKLESLGYKVFLEKEGNLTKVQIGPFNKSSDANSCVQDLKEAGYYGFVTVVKSATSKPVENAVNKDTLSVGDKVRMEYGAPVYGQTYKFYDWVYGSNLIVRGMSGNKIAISTRSNGALTGYVDRKYLRKI